MILARRQFLVGLGATLAAPAIVRASSLMPVKPVNTLSADELIALTERCWREMAINLNKAIYADLTADSFAQNGVQGLVRYAPDVVGICDNQKQETAVYWRKAEIYTLNTRPLTAKTGVRVP